MKQQTAYQVLLILAVVVAGLSIIYNVSLRENFGVTVTYTYPDPGTPPAQEAEATAAALPTYGDGTEEEDAWLYDDYETQPEEPVVLVTFPLELNGATTDQLMYIPRIGSATAQRIVQYRDVLGGYTDLLQLMDIKGIGQQTFETIEPYLYIAQPAPEEDRADLEESSSEPIPEDAVE